MTHKKKTWKKNLYENVDYPDNYTDKTFLEELKKNVHVTEVTPVNAVLGAGLVTQEMCIVVLFVVIYIYLHNGWLEPETVFVQSSLIAAVGYLMYRILLTNKNYIEVLVKDLRTVLIFVVFGYVLSPILKTLTDTISTDTIYAMTSFMMMIHLIFFDYGVSAAIVSSSLSLNAAIFGSVCLASRLSSPFHAFVLLTNAVECFVLLPILLSKGRGSIIVLTGMITVAVYSLWTISLTMTVLFVCITLFVTVLCPIWFLRWQNYKENIYGPWDEAVVHDIEM
ncbi:phosphatidylinositol N-acetylglucosaminyltransferase subunit C [Periplaneta americana]|uniref:phosphatidylinositol N-acetylglucosaminyltransferase subunit C n=1 Tax=Periplaneta americana TaxID=6978 RepID=UPI0037E790F3